MYDTEDFAPQEWEYYNPNPAGRNVGDCVVRALAKALNVNWERAYAMVAARAFSLKDMPSSNSVWGSILRENGFRKRILPDECPDCYTVEDFIRDNPKGTYVLGLNNHTATVKDGVLFDSWNSLPEIVGFYWYKE